MKYRHARGRDVTTVETELEYPLCPVCGGSRRRTVYSGTALPDALGAYAYGAQSVHHPIVECADCGIHYAHPRDSASALARHYLSGDASTYSSDEAGKRASLMVEIGRLTQRLPMGARVVEVGCATGLFLEEALRAGFDAEGLDIWEEAIAEARRRVGDRARLGRFETDTYPAGSVDAIVMWDVIEHVTAPVSLLRDAHRALRPGGVLALSTPDYGSLSRKILGTRWQFFERAHLTYFSARDIDGVLRKAGFSKVEIHPFRKTVSLRYLMTYGAKWSPRASQAALAVLRRTGRLGERHLTLPAGAVCAYARKSGSA